ncbi:MAG TPA: TlpA disulfide reductase family protein [Candidatus Binatia bacterium]|nr:TlpA disulfide reductase family protein [Candidatus Binatia bacterium]
MFTPGPNANRVALRDYRGKLVLVNFWATWCPPCRQEMPSMQVLNKKLANEGLTILGVNLREKPKEVETFSREHQLSFPMLLDEDGQVYDLYKVWSLPTTFIVDENGRLLLLSTVVGIRDWGSEETVNILRALLQQTV